MVEKVKTNISFIKGIAIISIFILSNSVFAQSATHWGYSGAQGPNAWGNLDTGFELCGKGQNQSPINIGKTSIKVLDKIKFSYRDTPIEILNNGHTIQANYQPGSHMTIAGKQYELLQFHFHSPSEHQIKGSPAPLEMHLVHKSADGVLAVVGIMFDRGRGNYLLDPIWENMPNKAKKTNRSSRGHINAAKFLPNDQTYYFYNGSLTTPPCSEGVKWFVMQNSSTVSSKQIKKFVKTVGENARPVQVIYSRNVRKAVWGGGSSNHTSSSSSHSSAQPSSVGPSSDGH